MSRLARQLAAMLQNLADTCEILDGFRVHDAAAGNTTRAELRETLQKVKPSDLTDGEMTAILSVLKPVRQRVERQGTWTVPIRLPG